MTDQQRKFNLQLWLMVGLLAGVIVAGFLLFPRTAEERDALLSRLGTTNHGTFIQPMLDITQLPLETVDASPWQYDEQKIKWRIVLPDDGSCRQDCRQMLHLTRQLHIRLGKNTGRLERIFLLLGTELAPETKELLDKDHPYLKVLRVVPEAFEQWIGAANTGWQAGVTRALLLDQNGRAMMFYTPQSEGNDMLEDLNHLLKYSPAP